MVTTGYIILLALLVVGIVSGLWRLLGSNAHDLIDDE
jgi:hypothetical protein